MDNINETNAQAMPDNSRLKELFAKRRQCGDNERLAPIMNDIAEEIVMNARFLSLVRTEKAGETTRISFALLNDGKGGRFYPLFTDTEELMKWQPAQTDSPETLVLAFDNYAQMIVDKNAADGFVVNPFGDNLLINRETVERWWEKKQIVKKGFTQRVMPEGGQAVFTTPKPFPTDLSEALGGAAAKHREIRRLWLREMEQDRKTGFLAVIDGDNIKSSVINELGEAARPFLKKYERELNVVFYGSELGKKAAENVLPVYMAQSAQ